MGRDYRKIEAFQLADDLVLLIYKITNNFPKQEVFGVTLQMRRAAVSIPANIAEGATRKSKKEYLRFLYIAMGSIAELEYYINLSNKLGYINNDDFQILNAKRKHAASKLFKLMKSVEKEALGGN